MYYLRSRDGLEIDLVFDLGGRLHLFEIKSSETVTDRHAASLKRLAQELGSEVQTAGVLSCTRDNYAVAANIMNFGWKNVFSPVFIKIQLINFFFFVFSTLYLIT